MTELDPATNGWKPHDSPGFFGVVGPLWTRKDAQGWAYALLAEERHHNRAGIVHGGMLCTLIDQALSAIAWEANERKPCITVALDVQFLAPVRAGDFIVARGEVVRQSSSLAFVRGTLTVEGTTVLSATSILRVKASR
jgi:uncharacterized protein (TIGR00369 family)